jgi:hypothetical protein
MREITKSQDLGENTAGASEKMNPNLHERALFYSFGGNIL